MFGYEDEKDEQSNKSQKSSTKKASNTAEMQTSNSQTYWAPVYSFYLGPKHCWNNPKRNQNKSLALTTVRNNVPQVFQTIHRIKGLIFQVILEWIGVIMERIGVMDQIGVIMIRKLIQSLSLQRNKITKGII